jgi:hypothetical protein
MKKGNYTLYLNVYTISQHKDYGKILTPIRKFYGNNANELQERFELWFIKQPLDRNDIETRIDYVQHASNN